MHTCPRRQTREENADQYRADGTCSYCGSMNEDDFMRACEAGAITLGPTDKSYKVYVNPSAKWPDGLPRPPIKFYFMHLSGEQKQRFLDLLIAGSLTIDFPGHFYTLPFFISAKR